MIALAGDAELDEGNIFEALLEGWKHDVRNLWWIIDYNRQSLDAVVSDRLFGRIDAMFEMFGWRVVTLKYGRLLQAAFARPDGEQLRDWIDACPNSLYSALVYKGGEGWREHLRRDLNRYPGIRAILDEHDDEALARLMTNLAGHDMGSVLDAFHGVADDVPTCFIAYTIKGYGLPFAAHKDNHAGLMTPEQVEALRLRMNIGEGEEWAPTAGLRAPIADVMAAIANAPFNQPFERRQGRVHADPEQRVASPQKWSISPSGQHIELGIAESNLFTLLAALGLSGQLFGARLLPIGTVYDPFICRGLDALNYACYQDARFMLVATPSGLALAPEGGAHQSVFTPLIGIGQPSLTAFEPAYVDELCEIFRWSFEHLQAADGGSVYLR